MPELILPVYSSRQCFNHCAFCTIPGATGGCYRKMPISRVFEIMCRLNEKYGTRVFSFVDETFEGKRMEQLADEGSVEKVGVEPDPKRVGPASWNLEYG